MVPNRCNPKFVIIMKCYIFVNPIIVINPVIERWVINEMFVLPMEDIGRRNPSFGWHWLQARWLLRSEPKEYLLRRLEPQVGTTEFNWGGWCNREKIKTPKNPMPNVLRLKNFKKGLYFICRSMQALYPQSSYCFWYPKESLLKSLCHSKKYFPNESWNRKPWTTQKSFDHLCHLKSGVSPLRLEPLRPLKFPQVRSWQ